MHDFGSWVAVGQASGLPSQTWQAGTLALQGDADCRPSASGTLALQTTQRPASRRNGRVFFVGQASSLAGGGGKTWQAGMRLAGSECVSCRASLWLAGFSLLFCRASVSACRLKPGKRGRSPYRGEGGRQAGMLALQGDADGRPSASGTLALQTNKDRQAGRLPYRGKAKHPPRCRGGCFGLDVFEGWIRSR